MKTFVVILAVIGLASADVSLGYHYSPPKLQTSYGTPFYGSGNTNSGFNTGYTGQSTGSDYKGQALSSASNVYQPSAGLQNGYPSQVQSIGGGYQGNAFQSSNGYQSGNGYQTGSGYQTGGNYAGAGSSGNQYHSSGSFGTVGVSSGSLQGGQYQSSNQYQSNYQQYYSQVQQQPAQVFKHFYVHAAPEEPEVARPRQPIVLPAPQKHYKIIFIKTPAPVAGATQFVPVQQQNEEKTIVYVLVKKPEVPEDVVIPKIEQKPPSKPEVFFIKYKGKEDSQAVINNIVNEYNSGKETVNVAGAFQSDGNSGTLDSISDVKYVSQPAGNSVGASVQALSGSTGSQYETNGASSSGSYNSGSSGSAFQSQSFGSSSVDYPSSTAGYQVSTGTPIQVSSGSGGYDSSNSGFSSTASSAGGQSAISSSQGIPHETYGTPNFRN